MPMKIIIENNEITYIKEKSKFIGYVFKVNNLDEITNHLNALKQEYHDATHICYAYILPNAKKYFDDNEPSGCAGKPILEILEKNNLNYVLAIVVRYFGGIKLGSNGLIRAYSNTIKEALLNNIKELENGYLIIIEDDYNKNNEINYLLKDSKIIRKDYQDKIYIEALVSCETLDKLSNINYIIKENVLM